MLSTRLMRCVLTACLIGGGLAGCFKMSAGRGTLIQPGAQAPELLAAGWINDPDGTAADIAGKVAVVDVWAFW